jgi:arginyl-tRNA synthetase
MYSHESDTGVYLQYAHPRFASIGRKAGLAPTDTLSADLSLLTEPHAFAVLRALAEYPEMVHTSLKVSEPSTIVTCLFKMTHLASTAYETLIVKGAELEVAKARYACLFGRADDVAEWNVVIGADSLGEDVGISLCPVWRRFRLFLVV